MFDKICQSNEQKREKRQKKLYAKTKRNLTKLKN